MFLSAAFDDPASKYILPAISVVPVALPFQADQDREQAKQKSTQSAAFDGFRKGIQMMDGIEQC